MASGAAPTVTTPPMMASGGEAGAGMGAPPNPEAPNAASSSAKPNPTEQTVLPLITKAEAADGGTLLGEHARPVLKDIAETDLHSTEPDAPTTKPPEATVDNAKEPTEIKPDVPTAHAETASASTSTETALQTETIDKLFAQASQLLLSERNPGIMVTAAARHMRGDTAIGAEARRDALEVTKQALDELKPKSPTDTAEQTRLLQEVNTQLAGLHAPDGHPFVDFLTEHKAQLTHMLGDANQAEAFIKQAEAGKITLDQVTRMFAKSDSPLIQELTAQTQRPGEAAPDYSKPEGLLKACGLEPTAENLQLLDVLRNGTTKEQIIGWLREKITKEKALTYSMAFIMIMQVANSLISSGETGGGGGGQQGGH